MHKEGPVCCTDQEERLHLQLPLLSSVELWAETSCSQLGSCGPCCHSGDLCSTVVQIRQEQVVCSGTQSPLHNPPWWDRDRRRCHLVKASPGLQGMAWLIFQLGCREKQDSTSTPDHALYWWFGRVKPLLLPSPVCFMVRQRTDSDPLSCFLLQIFCYSCTWVFKTSLQQQNQVGK